MSQLPLNVYLQNAFTFDSFYTLPANHELIALLKQVDDPAFKQLFIWGNESAGKSHILQAYCHDMQQVGKTTFYLPMKRYAQHGARILVGLNHYDTLVIDDLDVVLGEAAWEERIYDIVNERRLHEQGLIISTTGYPHELNYHFPDLRSRLLWGLSYRLEGLETEAQAIAAMRWGAAQRGFEINNAVVDFISRRYPMQISCLIKILDHLDRASMKDGRKITRMFAQQALESFTC